MIFANFSGGRDSSAMVVKWLEGGNPLDSYGSTTPSSGR